MSAQRTLTCRLCPKTNCPHDPQYIVRLIGQVVTVSLETVKLVNELATLPIDQA